MSHQTNDATSEGTMIPSPVCDPLATSRGSLPDVLPQSGGSKRSAGEAFATSATYATLFRSSVFDGLLDVYLNRLVNKTVLWGRQYLKYERGAAGWEVAAPYAWQKPDMKGQGGRFPFVPMSKNLILDMFEGKVSLALSAIDDDGCSRWLCFDSDAEDGSLDRLESFIVGCGLGALREGRRAGRAGHLWVFFDKPVRADLLIGLSNTMSRLAGVTLKQTETDKGIERFPKTYPGLSMVRAPFSINLKPEAEGVRGWFDGVEPDIGKQIVWLSQQPLNSSDDAIREALRSSPKAVSRRKSRSAMTRAELPRLDILSLVEHRQAGSEYVAQCPLCAEEGHDAHQDNLRVSSDGTKFCCVYQGPNSVHKTAKIARYLRKKN